MNNLFTKANIRKETICIGILAFLLFTLGLWSQPFVEFEARFALFAQEMWRHGPSLFPTTYGAPYPDYPSTSTLLIWISSLPFGGVTKLSAVLPTALAAALNLAITYHLLARFSRRWALATICFELMTVNFLAEARSISLDQMVATVTLCSFYLAYANSALSRPVLIRLVLLLITGFAIRGPLGVVIPAAVVCSYYLLSAQWKYLLYFGFIAAIVFIVCWCGLLGMASHIYGADFAREVVHMQVSGRMDLSDKSAPWYYFTSSFGNYAMAYPVAVIVILLLLASGLKTLHKPLGRDPESFLIYLIGWTLVILVGLSIPDTKKIRYLLPMVSPIAALAAYPFFEAAGGDRHQRMWILLEKILEKIFLLLPSIALIALWIAFQYTKKHALPVQLPFMLIAFLLVATQILVITMRHATGDVKLASILSGAVFTIWILNLLIAEPATLALHDTRQFVQEVESLRQKYPGDIAFFRAGKDASAIKYMVNINDDLRPHFLNDSAELDALDIKPVYIILPDTELPLAKKSMRLQGETPVLHDHFDHHDYSVFYLPASE